MKRVLLLPALALLTAPAAAQGMDFKFEVETLGGRKITQDHFKNNVVLVDFWGTWCGPCVKAVPHLVKLYTKYKHHGLEIIGLNYREGKNAEKAIAKVRRFAEQKGITYPLAMGTSEIQKQVIGFRGYPTMLMFKRGMKFDKIKVGFAPGAEKELEAWIRKALELDGPDQPTAKASPAEQEAKAAQERAEEDKNAEVPGGMLFRPGNGDTGFAHTFKRADGTEVEFKSLRGKKVILAMTSTWDEEADHTAKILQALHQDWNAKGVAVIAASLEISTNWSKRVAAVESFQEKHGLSYTIFPEVTSTLTKKIYKPGSIPLFLVFDEQGKLILRRDNDEAEVIKKAIAAALQPAAKDQAK